MRLDDWDLAEPGDRKVFGKAVTRIAPAITAEVVQERQPPLRRGPERAARRAQPDARTALPVPGFNALRGFELAVDAALDQGRGAELRALVRGVSLPECAGPSLSYSM